MRIGLVLECMRGGPDASVYPYVINKICPNIIIDSPQTLGNKKILVSEGPAVAQTLLENGCDYVFFIWDRKPRWDDGGNCATDSEKISNGLRELQVNIDKVILCCIMKEMKYRH